VAPYAGPVFTIGHSNRSLDALVWVLRSHEVAHVVDVRRFPRSRRHPHFDAAVLARELPAAGLGYEHAVGLGGFRRPAPRSVNTGLSTPAFQGYADYMQTADFARHLAALIATAVTTHIAIMCAEALPDHCHRSLLSDALTAQGLDVRHIIDANPPAPHTMSPGARIESGRVTYPGQIELFGR
jgi:uncharacterized protein (DUF488 family)